MDRQESCHRTYMPQRSYLGSVYLTLYVQLALCGCQWQTNLFRPVFAQLSKSGIHLHFQVTCGVIDRQVSLVVLFLHLWTARAAVIRARAVLQLYPTRPGASRQGMYVSSCMASSKPCAYLCQPTGSMSRFDVGRLASTGYHIWQNGHVFLRQVFLFLDLGLILNIGPIPST